MMSDSGRINIWRRKGTRNHPTNIIKRDRFGGAENRVWGVIRIEICTNFHIFQGGSASDPCYCTEIILRITRLFPGTVGSAILFINPPNRTAAVEELLVSKDIQRIDWYTNSFNLNPIENFWDRLRRRLGLRDQAQASISELILALQDE